MGGYFYNVYQHILDFAEDLQIEIDMNNSKNSDSHTFTFSDKTIDTLKECKKIIEVAGYAAKDIEALYSGDIDESTFLKNIESLIKKYDQ